MPERWARMLYADTERSEDMRYVLGTSVPDPLVAMELDGRWLALAHDLELGRLARTARVAVEAEAAWRARARELGLSPLGALAAAAAWLRAHEVVGVRVPPMFPLAAAERLRGWGFAVEVQDPFLPERAIKRPEEIREIARAQRLAMRAMRVAERLLRTASVRPDGRLEDEQGRLLTSERVRLMMQQELLAHGAEAPVIIVACGRQAADPHEEGRGPLRAGQPIVIDVFPRLIRSGYWGDMTRTFCKGKAPAQLVAMHRAVVRAQATALACVRAGVRGEEVHEAAARVLEVAGFATRRRGKRAVGFIHSTGHGVGLAIHEAPRLGPGGGELVAGHVVTIEPGLYYPRDGGVRVEDLVVVEEEGARNLTRYHKRLAIL